MGKASNRKRQRKTGATVGGFSLLSPGAPLPTPEDAAADVAAIALDRARFAACPDLTRYRRLPEPGEMRQTIPPGYDLIAVDVIRMSPGVRIRRPVFRRLVPSEIN